MTCLTVGVVLFPVWGCNHQEKRVSKACLVSPYGRQMTVAVVPVMNYSGNADIDTLKVTDILYSELQQVEGFSVVPVNRMLAQMARDRIAAVETPPQALKLAQELGAEAIIVSAITEYNPIYPPIVGLAVQVYGWPEATVQISTRIDPVAMERSAQPLKITADMSPKYWPKNQVQRIYNSRDKTVVKQVENFADDRGTNGSPYKCDIYLRSQEYYLRFVCFKTIEELLDKETRRMGPGVVGNPSPDVKEYN